MLKIGNSKSAETKESKTNIGKEALKELIRGGSSAFLAKPLTRSVQRKAHDVAGKLISKGNNDQANFIKLLGELDIHGKGTLKTLNHDVISVYGVGKDGSTKRINYVPSIPEKPDPWMSHGLRFNDPRNHTDLSHKSSLRLLETRPKYKGERTYAIVNAKMNPTAFLHELGHATGSDRVDTPKHVAIQANKILRHVASQPGSIGMGKHKLRYTPTSPYAASVVPSVAASLVRKKEGETSEQYLDRKQKVRHISNAISAIPKVPTLLEELRASSNAYKLGKKMGVPVDKKALGAAFGTYLSSLTPHAVRAATDIIARRSEKE